MQTQRRYLPKRVYGTDRQGDGYQLRLSDRAIDLGEREFGWYQKAVAWLPTARPLPELSRDLGLDETQAAGFLEALAEAGLLYRPASIPKTLSGLEFHRRFAEVLDSWLGEAFSHPFWARMTEGRGSARLFTGWLVELYHYTKNANRHMPLSCALAGSKPIAQLRAKHYAEEWNHFHYFTKALKALDFSESRIAASVPLPMTLALSNFMREAARRDVLAYSICSAVLEGTTTDRRTYTSYYDKVVELYGLPKGAITPIYAHLDLDVQYQHGDLFREILETVDELSAERAALILEYGHQLVEHIWLWTENIERYYEVPGNPLPRQPFDLLQD